MTAVNCYDREGENGGAPRSLCSCTFKYLRYGKSMLQMTLNILNMALMCGKRLKNLRNGFTMLEMT